jgi:hypothetical protein
MIEAGWTSESIERYAAFRYGEDVPAATVRTYKRRHQIQVVEGPYERLKADETVDVISARVELIRLQQERIGIDVKHERQMSKLFGATKGEIALLAQLLTEHKGDLQDLGLMPKAGQKIEVSGKVESEQSVVSGTAPRYGSLGEALGIAVGGEDEADLARVLHLRDKQARNGYGSNGTNGSNGSNGSNGHH